MKKLNNYSAGLPKPFFSWLNTEYRQNGKRILFLLLSTLLLTGCFSHYFQTKTNYSVDAATIERLKTANKYFIVHFENKIMGTQNLKLVNDTLQTELVSLPSEHSYYTNPKVSEKNPMKVGRQSNTIMEVHLYTNNSLNGEQNQIRLPLATINRMDVYEFDAKSTKDDRTWSTVGITAGTLIILFVLAASQAGGSFY